MENSHNVDLLQLPKCPLVKIFITNMHPKLMHHMVMNFLQTYKDIKEKAMGFDQELTNDIIIKIYK